MISLVLPTKLLLIFDSVCLSVTANLLQEYVTGSVENFHRQLCDLLIQERIFGDKLENPKTIAHYHYVTYQIYSCR